MQVKEQQLELDMEQQMNPKLGKEYNNGVYCHLLYLTYLQRTSWEMLGWMKHKLESRLPGEISITSDMQMKPPYGRKWRRTKEPLDESEGGEWKSWLITGPITSWQIDGETGETVNFLIFLGSKVFADSDCSHEVKRRLLLGRSYDQPRQHIKKQRHYFANKVLSSQSYGFSSSHVWMWERNYKESWVLKDWCF